MPLITQKIYKRSDLQNNKGKAVYVFGDNLARYGKGGQAYEVRGESNIIGIPTKHMPRRGPGAFFSNDDFNLAKASIDLAFHQIKECLQKGLIVVWPEDGVGTGEAELEKRAPKILAYIERKFQEVKDL